jgi:hypothetical protein
MTRRSIGPGLAATLALGALAAACGGSATPTSTTPESGGGRRTSSHNAGRDCLTCHRDFGAAGTVYRADGSAYAGATVRLTTAASGGGTVVLSLTSDGAGNFYASRSIAFDAGLYTDVAGTTGATRAMAAAVTSGACNSCHGAQDRILAD